MASLRREVLRSFRALHRASKIVFQGDERTLAACRARINEEFHKNRDVSDTAAIQEMLRLSRDVERELRQSVVQAVQVAPNQYALRMTPETRRLANVAYREDAACDTEARISAIRSQCEDCTCR